MPVMDAIVKKYEENYKYWDDVIFANILFYVLGLCIYKYGIMYSVYTNCLVSMEEVGNES